MSQAKGPRAIMSPEQESESDAALGFERQVERKDGLQGVSAKDLEVLSGLRDEVEDVINQTVTTVAQARLRIGRLLGEARSVFKGDKEFGQWRATALPQLAPRTCQQYMAMAQEYKSAPDFLESVGWSVAAELMNAPKDVQQQIRARAEEGDKPTVAEVRELKSATPPSIPVAQAVAQPARISLDDRFSAIINQSTSERIAAITAGEFSDTDEYTQACIVMGLNMAAADQEMNFELSQVIVNHLREGLDKSDAIRVGNAYSVLKKGWT